MMDDTGRDPECGGRSGDNGPSGPSAAVSAVFRLEGNAMAKIIISCAVTGAIHTPSMSAYLPITAEEIARSSIDAAEAGAAIIHLHARNEVDGSPTPDPAVFMKFLPVIKQSTDAVINITTGGGLTMTLEERLGGPPGAQPQM